MPILNSIIVCDEVKIIPGEKVFINGIFDSIYARDFPAVHPSLAIYVRIEIDENEKNIEYKHSYEIRREEDDKVVFTYPEQKFVAEKRRHQFVHKIKDLYLEKEGKYTINIFIDGRPFATTYFFAKKNPNSIDQLCIATKKMEI